MQLEAAAALFACLASPYRLQAFRLLVAAGPAGRIAGEISSELGIIPSAASFHLKALMHAGLVTVTAEGRHQRYRANLALMQALTDWLGEACCGGQPDRCLPPRAARPRVGGGGGQR
jgi:ArsR family transcriptional regulator, arsenate/arsenite/antimonite-responsive transcriptional repressor